MKNLILAAVALIASVPVSAETIRMRDGSYHAGEVVSSDDEVVRIRFTATGLELDMKWEQLAPGEARRLKAQSVAERASRFLVDGEVITTKTGQIIEGIVQGLPDADPLKVKTSKDVREIRQAIILKREKTKINALSVYSPDELYASKSSQYNTATAAGNFDLGEMCLAIKMWPKAVEHFQKAIEIDVTWKPRVDPRLALAQAGIKEEEAAALLADAEKLFGENKHDEGLAILAEIIAKYAGTSAATRAQELSGKMSEDADAFKNDQKAANDVKRAAAYYAEMKSLIGKVATDKKLTFQEIKDYVEKTMPTEILTKLAEKEKMDVKVLEEQWKARHLKEWKQASYMDGSWLMEGDTLAIESVTSLDDARNKNKNQQLIADLKAQAAEQRKMTDEWWKKQSQTVKNGWLTAYAAERTMIIKPAEHLDCSKCRGKGLLGATALCLRCLGIGKDRIIHYK